MPSISGSAYHRRRSLRGRSNAIPPSVREQLKENDPYNHSSAPALKTPAHSGYTYTLQPPSILSSRNAGNSAVRELFTTPRTPAHITNNVAPVNEAVANPHLNAHSQAAWRPTSVPAPVLNLTNNNLPPADVHASRVVHAVFGASIIGTLSLNFLAYLARMVLFPYFSGGLFWFLLCTCLSIFNLAMFFFFLGMSENVFSAEHPRLAPQQFALGIRHIFSKRSRLMQLAASGFCGAAVVFSVSFCIGAVYRNNPSSVFFPMWSGLFCGLVHSYLSQITGVFTWRFSPTRETVIKRVRGELLFSALLAASSSLMGCFLAYVDFLVLRRIVFPSSRNSASMMLYVSARIHFTTLISACMSMAALCLVCTIYMHMMTVAMNVRDYISDSSINSLRSKEDALRVVHRLLYDISPENRKQDGLIALNRMLGIQFFRDVARTSRAGRRIIFEDSESVLWNGVMQGCVEPVKDLTQELMKSASNSSPNSAGTIDFADGRAVAWACETLSHFLVASRNEDDFGIVQRQFVHVVLCLLALKNCVDSARNQRRIQRTPPSFRTLSSSKFNTSLQSPQDVYFAIDVVGATVGDAVDLALVRIVDAFRAHLKGFLVGSEPHWDRRFDQSLSAVLESSQ